jgi:hypothetical protein
MLAKNELDRRTADKSQHICGKFRYTLIDNSLVHGNVDYKSSTNTIHNVFKFNRGKINKFNWDAIAVRSRESLNGSAIVYTGEVINQNNFSGNYERSRYVDDSFTTTTGSIVTNYSMRVFHNIYSYSCHTNELTISGRYFRKELPSQGPTYQKIGSICRDFSEPHPVGTQYIFRLPDCTIKTNLPVEISADTNTTLKFDPRGMIGSAGSIVGMNFETNINIFDAMVIEYYILHNTCNMQSNSLYDPIEGINLPRVTRIRNGDVITKIIDGVVFRFHMAPYIGTRGCWYDGTRNIIYISDMKRCNINHLFELMTKIDKLSDKNWWNSDELY